LGVAFYDDNRTDAAAMRPMLFSMSPALLQTLVFSQVENLTNAQIA